MSRNIVNEILTVKERTEFESRLSFSQRLEEIDRAITENQNINGHYNLELLKYIPIATIACVEAFFRSTIKELVDFGKPFSDYATRFNQSNNIRFDFDLVNAIQAKSVTIGEIVAHVLPCSSVDDINKNLSTLMNLDFFSEIKKFKSESVFEIKNDINKVFYGNFGQILDDLRRTFELRHIFCHEFGEKVLVNEREILRCFTNVKTFLNQTNFFIWYTLYPNAPETQAEMNSQSLNDFLKKENELQNVIINIKEASKEWEPEGLNSTLFDTMIEKWKIYREERASLHADFVQGGTLYPLLYNRSKTYTTSEKIGSLLTEYSRILKKKL